MQEINKMWQLALSWCLFLSLDVLDNAIKFKNTLNIVYIIYHELKWISSITKSETKDDNRHFSGEEKKSNKDPKYLNNLKT